MRVKHSFRTAVIGLGAALCIFVTGCAAELEDETDAKIQGAAQSNTSEVETSETETNQVEETETEEESQARKVAPEKCIQGRWLADNDFFLASMRELGDEVKEVTGQVHVTFGEDGTLSVEYNEWLITAEGYGQKMTFLRTGTDTGTYAATADSIDFTETNIDSSISVDGGGLVMNIVPTAASYQSAPYTCDQTTAMISTIDGTMKLSR